jgi:anti-sigma factor RsiW
MMIGHRKLVRQLDAYVDGELSFGRVSGLESHLHDCPDCNAHVRLLLAMKGSLLRAAGPYRPV